jgi:TctA family transporter
VPDRHLKTEDDVKAVRIGVAVAIAMKSKVNLINSSIIGMLVSILPGAGGSASGLIAYSEVKCIVSPDQKIGEGEPDGIIATESANNATIGGGFILTLLLGLILGPIAEQGFVQSWIIGSATNDLIGMFFDRPISLAIVAFTLLPIFLRRQRVMK